MFYLKLRQKIFLSYFILFFVFLALLFPFSTQTVKSIIIKSMQTRTEDLIKELQHAKDNEELVRELQYQKPLIFFRVSIITNERKVLYDTHTKRILGPEFSQDFIIHHPEVIEAMEYGTGYHEEFSEILGQKFAYFAKTFNFHGKRYILRTAFPFKYVQEVTDNFEIGFLVLSAGGLLLFSFMTWFVMHRLTRPIDEIIRAVKPYQEGKAKTVPEIKLQTAYPEDDYWRLASTLNTLSRRIQKHIDTVEEERNEKESILDSLIEGVVAIDPQMVVHFMNPMAKKLLGIEEDLVGKSFSFVKQPACDDLLIQSLKSQEIQMESLELVVEGQRRYLDMIALPTGHRGSVLVLQDKTKEHKMLEMRKDFVANASHELKTPVTIVRGFAETLHDNPDLEVQTRNEINMKIVHNCQRMANIIKDLLALSDVENLPKSRVVECDLLAMANHCKDLLFEYSPDAIVEIKPLVDGDIIVQGDPDLLELALMNLMENAVKYSDPPAKLQVIFNQVGGEVEIQVKDEGIGIPESDLEHVFQRFYTVNKAHSRKMGGSGLGLSIVQTIVEKHFGQISVSSKFGQGTTFTILLPTELEKMLDSH